MYKDKKVAIIGFGLEGKDAYFYLLKQGAIISLFDQKSQSELDLTGISKKGVSYFFGKDYDLTLVKNYDYVIRSPGVYRYLTELVNAEKVGVVVTSSVNIFFEICPAKIIGITGTKGKGTTSTLIYEILRNTGKKVFLAGNIGKPMLEILPKLKPTDWVVLELSSFQLIDLAKSPNISVVLNITLDHMDWHKSKKEYVDAKKNISTHQRPHDITVINSDYKESAKFQSLGSGKKYFFSVKRVVKGAYIKLNNIYFDKTLIGPIDKFLLRGKHNWENICAAVTASKLAGATFESIKRTIYTFKGLEHRLELVRDLKGIRFYNDSFSTNPQTTIAAIKSFTEPITVILGGFNKKLQYDGLASEIAKSTVTDCVLIGDISAKIKRSLIKAKYRRSIIEMGYSTMSKVVRKCFDITKKGGVVILSPATSSFDMFENYKVRGAEFKRCVKNL